MNRIPEAVCSMVYSLPHRVDDLGSGRGKLAASPAFAASVMHSDGMHVVYLALGPGASAPHADDLRAFGFEVSVYPSVAEACSALVADAVSLIALQTEPAAIHLAVAQLRLSFPRSGIVVMAKFPDRLSRVGAMLSGADSCVEAASDSLELMAALLACRRRLQIEELHQRDDGPADSLAAGKPDWRRAAPEVSGGLPKGGWHLENHGWILVAPNGSKLDLNHSERRIMALLLNNPQEPLTRLSQGASYNPENGKITRGLDIAISRLRRKAAGRGISLPIRSIRGEGYVFVGNEPSRAELKKMGGSQA